MKKYFFLFSTLLLTLNSCQQEDLNVNEIENTTTRASVVKDYYTEEDLPIYQLLGMPVYIINRGNTNINGKYLTAYTNYIVNLADKNPNQKQKWIIDPYDKTVDHPGGGDDDIDAHVNYGVYSFDMNSSQKYLGIKNNVDPSPSIINKGTKPKFYQWQFTSREAAWTNEGYTEGWFPNGYYRIFLPEYNPWWNGYLLANSSNIFFGSGRLTADYWEIQPAENFKLSKLTWILEPEDVIKALPTFMDQASAINNSAATANMTITFNKKASESSSFSKSTGTSIQVNTSAKVGVPLIASGKIDINTTTTANWQWGSSETHEDSRTYSFALTLPPYTSVTAKVMVQISELSASYVADFVGEISGRPLRISGKWEGVQAGNIYYEIVDNKTQKVLQSFSGLPKSAIIVK